MATRLGEDTLGKLAQRSERPAVRNLMAALAEAETPEAISEIAKRLMRVLNAKDQIERSAE